MAGQAVCRLASALCPSWSFSSLPVALLPWPCSLRCSWPCCRSASAWSCCRSPSVRIAAGAVVVHRQRARRPGDPRPGWFHLAPGLLSARSCRSRPGVLHLVPDRRRRCRYSPAAGRVILRQLRGLDPAAWLLVALVAVVAVLVLVVLFFARGPVPWPGWLRGPWPCCRPSAACFCRLPPVRIAAGRPVVGVALVVLVAFKEQGGPGCSARFRACCWPVWSRLAPGLLSARSCRSRPGGRSTWCRSCCLPGEQPRRPGLDPVSGLLVPVVAVVVVAAVPVLVFSSLPVVLCLGPVRFSVTGKKRSFFFLCLRDVIILSCPLGQKNPRAAISQAGKGRAVFGGVVGEQ